MRKISEEQLNKIASYLASKPYIEVVELIQMLGNLEAVEEDVKK